ncbi:MAG: hypothetical protein ACLTSL_06765, partial [Odoribacter splanchnicus]
MFTLNVGLFFLSIPIPGFIPSDRFAWNGPLRLPLISSEGDPKVKRLLGSSFFGGDERVEMDITFNGYLLENKKDNRCL